MKKVAYLGIFLILLAVLVVPAMAKTPGNGNGNGKGNGNNGNAGQDSSAEVVPADQGHGNQTNQTNHNNQGNMGHSGGRGNGNQGQSHPNTPFYLQGTITAIFSDTQTISVTVTHGNAMVKQFIGLNITIKATDATQIFKITQGNDDDGSGEGESTTPALSSSETATNDEGASNRVAIPFDQLAVGQSVAIHGNLVEGVYTARLITVYIRMPVGESTGETP